MEDLEWDFAGKSDRKVLQFSNGNKNVKNIGESYASIKLKNKTTNNDKEYKVTIKNEIKYDDWLHIGVCDRDWGNRIYYDNRNGNIRDNDKEIKKLEKILKSGDSLKIKDTFYGKINDKKVYKVSIHKNQEKLCETFYSQEERKTLLLYIGPKIQLEVNVKGTILTNNWQYQNYLILISCQGLDVIKILFYF